ncbi:MAG: hypothetical protein K2Z81_13560, partial [Cyanobacteria bacterium]|nr:hypothetical protein [Cyanobacteriota bacterium]
MLATVFITIAIIAQVVSGVLFSPYKDVTINIDMNTKVLTTAVTGSSQSVLSVLPQSGADTLTWAFAIGNCGSESWGVVDGKVLEGTALAEANVKSW